MADKNAREERGLAVVVDDNGRLQAQFGGPDAKGDAYQFLKDAQKGGVRHLRGASVVSGPDALKAMQNGRI